MKNKHLWLTLVVILAMASALLVACGDDDDDDDFDDADQEVDDDDSDDDSDDDDDDDAADDDDDDNPADYDYPVVDTGQTKCYDDEGSQVTCPSEGGEFNGQDAQFDSFSFNFQDNGDDTVSDLVTELMWEKIPSTSSYSWEEALAYCESLTLADYEDWRAPSLKELFSISDFETGWPYIDTGYFDLAESNTTISKDEQYWSSNFYEAGTTHGGQDTAFGVNHGTGHIKGYPSGVSGPMGNYVRCVRGEQYGVNEFVDNGDGAITDNATGLMWMQADSGEAIDWKNALTYAENLEFAGYNDWRLPNVKELQSIVDYSRTERPAIDPLFACTGITNEAGDPDYGYYWTSTSAYFGQNQPEYYYAWYVAFGYAVDEAGNDTHGAGAVRFDTKVEGGPAGEGGERCYNYVRVVRGGPSGSPTDDDDDDSDDDMADDDDSDMAPPPEAVEACEGKEVGDDCEFEGMQGEPVTGACQMDGEVLACMPEGGPPSE